MSQEFQVLISDPLPDDARRILASTGRIQVITEEKNYDRHLPTIQGWIVRSGTKITRAHIEAARQLTCICRAGAGVDNVDLEAATRHGVVVMNTPDGNSVAAAEHAVALLLSLARNIPFAHAQMMGGGWGRTGFVGVEVEGKHVGVVGLGKVGRIAARKFRGLGMKVLGSDPFISEEAARDAGVELVALEAMLPRVDFLSVHVPLTSGTKSLIGAAQLARAKPGIRIVNTSRGGVVDEKAALEAIEKGIVAGLALDVFSTEPLAADSPLRNHPRIVTTPHLGASTLEAQEQVALLSAQQIRDFLLEGTIANAVNAPSLAGADRQRYGPLAAVAHRLGSLHAQILEGQPKDFHVEVEERLLKGSTERLLVDNALAGFLGSAAESTVNIVNARFLATERGISVSVKGRTRGEVYLNSMRIDVTGPGGTHSLEGAVVWESSLRLVRIDNYSVDVALDGPMLFTGSTDRPGMVGRLGAKLGALGHNIANMCLGRDAKGGLAIAIFNLDGPMSPDDVAAIAALDGVTWARFTQPR